MKKALLVLCVSALGLPILAQNVPNNGFENWSDGIAGPKYQEPNGWTSTNEQTGLITNGVGISKSTTAHSGTYAAQVTTVSIGTPATLYTGILTNGLFTNSGTGITGGSPFNYLPDSVFLYYQYSSSVNDSGYVLTYFFNHNNVTGKRDTIGYGGMAIKPASQYMRLAYRIGVRDTGHQHTVDSVLMIFVSNKNTGNPQPATMLLDDISFGAAYDGIDEQTVTNCNIKIWPNPTSSIINIENLSSTEPIKLLTLFNAEGKKVLQLTNPNNETHLLINVSAQSTGIYLLETQLANGSNYTQKVLITK